MLQRIVIPADQKSKISLLNKQKEIQQQQYNRNAEVNIDKLNEEWNSLFKNKNQEEPKVPSPNEIITAFHIRQALLELEIKKTQESIEPILEKRQKYLLSDADTTELETLYTKIKALKKELNELIERAVGDTTRFLQTSTDLRTVNNTNNNIKSSEESLDQDLEKEEQLENELVQQIIQDGIINKECILQLQFLNFKIKKEHKELIDTHSQLETILSQIKLPSMEYINAQNEQTKKLFKKLLLFAQHHLYSDLPSKALRQYQLIELLDE